MTKQTPQLPPLTWIEPLARPVFAALPASLRAQLTQVRLRGDSRLSRQGNTPEQLWYLLGGEVCLTRCLPDGQELILQRVRQGFVAEGSVMAQTYHCDISVSCPSHLLALPLNDFRTAMAMEAPLAQAWISYLSARLRTARSQTERLRLHKAEDRIRHYLITEGDNGRVELGGTRKQWAAELGMSHEALYRAMRRMQDNGELVVTGRAICLGPP
jgi:CRP/FNR family transcriptional regulator, dissimilatory nitrate respiration regulator